ncbi:MAG TPA: hypothetical protein DIW23_01565 [Anaerolineae bacterium]|nr:hypothetical protein [Anaerolineae bacterium]
MKYFYRNLLFLVGVMLVFIQTCSNEMSIAPAETSTLTSTSVPLGVFVVLSHPPLIMNYEPSKWEDKSKYFDNTSVLNYLQTKELSSCKIGIQDPAGYYEPYESETVTLGNIDYTIIYPDSTSSDYVLFLYLDAESFSGYRYDLYGLPVFGISSNSSEWEECKKLGEEVLSTLRIP